MENKRYTAEEVLNLQSQAYQKGCNEGYELCKKEHPRIGWVKASEFKYEVGVAYSAKDSKSRGAGSFDESGIFKWGDDSLTLPHNQGDLLILDESAAGREEDNAVAFAEWLLEYGYEPSFEKKWVDYSKTGDNRVSSAQLYELFKQQKEK